LDRTVCLVIEVSSPPVPSSLRGSAISDKLRNSSVFRQVNERIREVSTTWADVSEPIGFLCECGDATCTGVMTLNVADYDTVRSAPGHFLLLRGHELPEAEEVVARTNGYLVVAQRTSPAA
jgi:hypothetical protein